MSPVRAEAEGARPVEQVWHDYVRPDRWPGWALQIRGTRGLSSPLVAGERGTVLGPVGLRVPVRILAVDPAGRTWSWRVGPGPLAVRMDHGVVPLRDGARAWMSLRAPTVPFALYRPVAALMLRRLTRA